MYHSEYNTPKIIEVKRVKTRSKVPRVRKKNHLIVMFPATDESTKTKVYRELKKMISKLDHLLEDGMSFEFHY